MVFIGVTGHRFITETNKVIDGIDKALEMIKEKFGSPLFLVSALAEGADRLIVHRAQAKFNDTKLIVYLPLSLDDYMDDFESLVSKAEFINLLETAEEVFEPEEVLQRDQAYLETGKWVINNCDVVVAIWDGQSAQGKGGTGDIITLVREKGMPLAWIHAGNRKPGTKQPVTLGKDQGKVSYEGF